MSLLPAIGGKDAPLQIWLVDVAGNVAMSQPGLALLRRIKRLHIPFFASTEQATAWGSRLNAEQHATLLDIQRTSSSAALGACDLQQMVNLATQSQLLREAADAFVPGFADGRRYAILPGGHPEGSSHN